MKNWLRIGQFSKQTGLSARALRIYEEIGLICSHARGDNGYRYYREDQLELALRIKNFKDLGFSLEEVKSLLLINVSMDAEELKRILLRRLSQVQELEQDLSKQKNQIEQILSSLKQKDRELKPNERRYIMSHFEKVSIVVTGKKGLSDTAKYIGDFIPNIKIYDWNDEVIIPKTKPYILVIPEKFLSSDKAKETMPDVVVIKDIDSFTPETESSYLNLYAAAGPHMTTVFNADDRVSIELAANPIIKRGRIFYFSKNSGLEEQIKKIGGVVSDGEEVSVFGFNLTKEVISLQLNKVLGFDQEVALLASLAAVLDIGLKRERFNLPKL